MTSPYVRQPQSRLHGRARDGGAPAPLSTPAFATAYAPLGGTSSDGPAGEVLIVTIFVPAAEGRNS